MARRDSSVSPWGLLPLVVLLAAWQAFGNPASPYYPPPLEWWRAVATMLRDGELLVALWWTSWTFVAGLAVATAIGAVAGSMVGARPTLDRAAGPSFEFLRSLPAAALVPATVLVLGYTVTAKLVLVVLPSTWPILLACRSARRSMSPVVLDVSRTLHLSRRDHVLKVLTPSLATAALLGVRVAAPVALVVTILVEMVTRIHGLGALLGRAQSYFRSDGVFGLLVVAGLLGYLVNVLVARVERATSARMSGS